MDCQAVYNAPDGVFLSYAVVERLARLVEENPAQVMRCLERLIKGETMMWTTSTWETSVWPMLTYALQQEGTKPDDEPKPSLVPWRSRV
jgi:hypothetical protein